MNQHHILPDPALGLGGVILRDVTLRDGLQLTGKVLSTERKLETVRELLRLGVPAIELGSMARPDLVPTMANTLEVVQNLNPEELEKCWIWVATPGHVAKAAAAGARNFQYCLSASDSHNKANIGRTTEESLAALPQAVEYAQAVNGQIQLCIATSFTCPFEGTVPEERVLAIANDPRAEGTSDIVLCDTLGQAIPAQVSGLIQRVRAESPARRIGLPRARHLGPGRGQHPRRYPGRRRDGGRRARRTWRLSVRPGRQRQHVQRGHPVRHPARLGDPRNLRGPRGPLREAAGRARRTKPLQGGAGRQVQGPSVPLGHPVGQSRCARNHGTLHDNIRHDGKEVGMGYSFLVTTAIPDPGLQLLSDAGTVTVLPTPPDYDTLAALCASGEYDVVLTQLRDVVDAPLLASARVKGVSNFAVGYNNIDVDAATRHGILVGNTPGVLTDATADIAMLLILGTARRVVEADRLVRDGNFHGWEPELLLGRDVSGAVLGLAGFGRIARAAARRALGFGMEVLFAPRPPGHRQVSDGELGEFAGKVQQVSWDQLVERSDFLSLHGAAQRADPAPGGPGRARADEARCHPDRHCARPGGGRGRTRRGA